ncbi:acyltransferas-like protein [Plenodomus tracheiphilus IPT5]|uniref:Acyltransferas-like protein n=1 Tax=Plenodomus tracheiphilus IPT5 TaxID=1408161 RepID=A0A6A7B496_9PLEO|nr:acyltransferas-like protein [Plenodomus tracheiphilus IPT5]
MPAKLNGFLDHGQMEEVNLHSATWKPTRTGRWSLDVVRPEFLSLRPSSPKASPLRPTAWLDGLRGFAAFLVYIHHNQLWSHGIKGNIVFENSFGYQGRHYFAALPFVRTAFSGGHFAVTIFFVISGYVLSVKSMGLVHKGQHQAILDVVGSALFRRWLRLYIPVITVTFLWLCMRHATGVWMNVHQMNGSFREDVKRWYETFKNYSFVFSTNHIEFSESYHPHTWTIPLEFQGSIIVYTALPAFARCTRNARIWCEVALIFYFLYVVDGYHCALFMAGMLLCDLDLLAQADKLPRFLAMLAGFKEFLFFHLFIVALYLGGVPSFDTTEMDRYTLLTKSPGWKWLSHLKPQAVFDAKWFYLFWAALFTVASIPRLPWLKRFFENRVCQYLARISFALYLVHGPVIWLFADRIYAAVGLDRSEHAEGIPGWVNKFPLSRKGPMGLELAFWLPQFVIFPVTLYAAEVVTKVMDEPSVKVSNWLYKKMVA